MDERDRAICQALWRLWSNRVPTTYRNVTDRLGLAPRVLLYRLGRDRANTRARNLISEGWLKVRQENLKALAGSLRPGPRFAGLDHGRPLEFIG